ncbi:polysaccharide lyase family 7 protein [Bacteroidota bacterium]
MEKSISSRLILFAFLQLAFVFNMSAQDPNLPPGGNFDLTDWKITLPDQTEVKELGLSDGFESPDEFYTDPGTGAMVFRCPNNGATGGSSYPRCELREMLRAGNTSINTKGVGLNNWVFSSSSESNQKASGGIDGSLSATVAIDHVSTTGESSKVGRVIIGQIHASDDEPCRLYYRKLPGNTKGSFYFAHEPRIGSEQWHEMIGSRSSSASNPSDGIELGEVFSYEIKVVGNTLTVTILRPGKPDVRKIIDMSASGFTNDWMYFKAGVYNQNDSGDSGDYCQVSFLALSNTHSDTINHAPLISITKPSIEETFNAGENITISANASDSDDSISKVEFFQGTTKLGECTSIPYTFTWNSVPEGSYVLSATAFDNHGLATISPGINIIVDPSSTVYNAPYEIPRFQAFMDGSKLQAPTSATIATTSDLMNGYSSDWFYVAEGDKVAFNQSGDTNRTELRHLSNWTLSEGDRSFHGRLKFVEQTCDHVTVVQIHDDANAGDGPNKPLLRIYKHLSKSPANHLWAAIKTDAGGVNTKHLDLGMAPTAYFNWDVYLEGGYLIVLIDSVEIANEEVSFWTFPSYWKAGVYLQDEGEATVYFDELYHDKGTAAFPQKQDPSPWINYYPNPASSFITIDLGNNELLNGTIVLFDIEGRIQQEIRITGKEVPIQLPENSGLYVLKIVKGDFIKTLRVIKE